jgi:hypothetical protein
MHIEAEVDTHVGTQVDLVALLGLSVLTLNMIMNKWSEIFAMFSKNVNLLRLYHWKNLKPSFWHGSSIHQWNTSEKKALHVAAYLGINSFQASNSWIDHFQKRHNLVYKTILRESVIVNPETVMDWKSEELAKMIDGYQPKEIINVDETRLFYILQPSMILTY